MTAIKLLIASDEPAVQKNSVIITEADSIKLQGECGKDFDGPVMRLHEMIITWEDDEGVTHADAFTILEE